MIFNSCKESELEELYPHPGKISTATIENMFTGVLKSSNEVVLPWYWRFFVCEQPTMGRYTQVMGWLNGSDQYIPSAQAMDWRWDQYYQGPLTQFRVMQDLYNQAEEKEKTEKRIFMLAATIFHYDQTLQVVDLYDDIPWTEAGYLRKTGDLTAALPVYDNGQAIYTAVLDDLKAIADELSTITVETFYAGLFKEKDYLNDGSVDLWRKYCNSLRLRLLVRVSDVMADRAGTEIAEILGNPTKYPIVDSNEEAIMLDAGGPDLYATTSSQNGGIKQAMETWGQYDIAPKAVVDHMVNNTDPRLVVMFDANEDGDYIGMNPLDNSSLQNQQLNEGLIARYDTSTFTRNDYFPGFVITAGEVSFLKAEIYQKGIVSGDAKDAYETGISQSINMYYDINSTGDYRDPIERPDEDAINAYIGGSDIAWDLGTDKIGLIAEQKWLNSGLGQMALTWAEMRRLDKPELEFLEDSGSGQKLPPVRWLYPESEKQLNEDNYNAVKSKDNLNNKIFWDLD
jgi:hypothetical protein